MTIAARQLSHPAASGALRLLVTVILCAMAAFLPRAAAQSDLPDETTLSRLVWHTMVTLDNANSTGNYSVLSAIGAPPFRNSQTPERLSGLFGGLREKNVDLSRTLTIAPRWDTPPAINENGYLRLRGGFESRPRPIRFDMLFGQYEGEWKLLGLSVVEMDE